jgi:IS1 family transposase
MNRLSTEERARVLSCLVEGNSIRATERMTGITKKAITRLSVELGEACERFATKVMVNLPCTRIQCDEIWAFCGAKEKNASAAQKEKGWGDVWTWVAIDPDTKLIPAWFTGDRTTMSAYKFLRSLSPRLANRVQVSTDGHKAYALAMKAGFHGSPVDYGTCVKIYAEPWGEGKYSPGVVTGTKREIVFGCPIRDEISTSHAERQNLTMRMQMRRFTRLTNGFSKKVDNHRLAVAIHFVHYNFARVHSAHRLTPAMAAGLSDHVWSLAEIVGLLEAEEVALCA